MSSDAKGSRASSAAASGASSGRRGSGSPPPRPPTGTAEEATCSSLYPSLLVKNTFLEFPPELWMLSEDAPQRRRVCSQPPLSGGRERTRAPFASVEGSGEGSAAGDESLQEFADADAVQLVAKDRQLAILVASAGSLLHEKRRCKPCAFAHTKGCTNGINCQFCHLCGPDEKRRRQKDRWENKRRSWRQFRQRDKKERAAGSEKGAAAADAEAAPTGAIRQAAGKPVAAPFSCAAPPPDCLLKVDP